MQKKDLKTGMVVTLRNGMEYVVFRDIDAVYLNGVDEDKKKEGVLVSINNNWEWLSFYKEDLSFSDLRSSDIIKVELPYHPYSYMNLGYCRNQRTILWEEKVKEFTIAELEKHFGCKVKIIKED